MFIIRVRVFFSPSPERRSFEAEKMNKFLKIKFRISSAASVVEFYKKKTYTLDKKK